MTDTGGQRRHLPEADTGRRVLRGARAHVVVASTRAAAGTTLDRTGPMIRSWCEARGLLVSGPEIVEDGAPVGESVRRALEVPDLRVLLVTGGTGVSPSDRTPEEVRPLLELEIPGIVAAIRAAGTATVPTAILTRGVAGFARRTFVLTLPGSPGGVRDGLEVLDSVLAHLLTQRDGV